MRSRARVDEGERRQTRECERDGALSHDRARCNARAAMHKQRRASRSAPAKVTRVMSRCPLCRTNSAHSAESALSPSLLRRGASGRGTRGRGNRPTAPPPDPSTRVPSRWNPLLKDERGNPVVKSQCKRGASARSGADESALCNARGHADATSRKARLSKQ